MIYIVTKESFCRGIGLVIDKKVKDETSSELGIRLTLGRLVKNAAKEVTNAYLDHSFSLQVFALRSTQRRKLEWPQFCPTNTVDRSPLHLF